jgi:GNAT superfamily N-acetyltransferase/uncharacterized protein YjiS (DUF1127 family)
MSTGIDVVGLSSAPSNQPSFSIQSESKDLFTMKFVAFEDVLQDNTSMQQTFEETMAKFTVYLTSSGTSVDKITTSCKYISSNFVAIRRRTEALHSTGHLRATREKQKNEDYRNLALSFNEGDVILEFEMSFSSYYVDVSEYNKRFLGWVRNNYATVGNELVTAGIELIDVTFIGYTNTPAPSTSSPTLSPSKTLSTKPSAIPVSLLSALEESTGTDPSTSYSPTYTPTVSSSPTTFQGYIQSEASKSAQLAIVLTTGCIALLFLIRFFILGQKNSDEKNLPLPPFKKKKKRQVIESDDEDDSEIYISRAMGKKSNKSAEALPLFPISSSVPVVDSSDDSAFIPVISKDRSYSDWEEQNESSQDESFDDFSDPLAAFSRKRDVPQDRKSRKQQDVNMIDNERNALKTDSKIQTKDVKPKRSVTQPTALSKKRSANDLKEEEAISKIQVEDVKSKHPVTKAPKTRKRRSNMDIKDDMTKGEVKGEMKVEDVKPKRPTTKSSAVSKRRSVEDLDEMEDDLSLEESKDEMKVEDVKPERLVTKASAVSKRRSVEDLDEMEDNLAKAVAKDEMKVEDVKPERLVTKASAVSKRRSVEDLDEMEDDLSLEKMKDEINEEEAKDEIEDTADRKLSEPIAIRRRSIYDVDDDFNIEKDKDEIKEELIPNRSGAKVHGVSNKDIDDDLSLEEINDVEDTKPEISIAESFAASFLKSRRKDLDIVIPPKPTETLSERPKFAKSPNSILKKDDEFEDLVAVVDKVLAGVRLPKKLSYAPRFRRATSLDMHAVHEFLALEDVPLTTVEILEGDMTRSRQNGVMPFYIIIEEKEEDGGYYMMGISLWSFGYSTWKGRIMNLDLIIAGVYEQYMMTCLAKIAQSLDCQRIEYRAPPKIASIFKDAHGADLLSEWITLRIGRTDMTKFLQTKVSWSKRMTNKGAFGWLGQNQKSNEDNERVSHSNKTIKESIDILTEDMNKILGQRSLNGSTSIRLRQATKYDARSILEMVHDLADFENAPNEVTVSSSTYKRDIGGPIPMFHCILVETVNNKDLSTEVVGYCVFYVSYSPKGKYLWLEDLFIQDDYRRLGCGKALMYVLAQLAMDRKYHSLLWQVLEWNKIALDFYEKLDVPKVLELEAIRFDNEKMNQMLSKRSKSTKISNKTASITTSRAVEEARQVVSGPM